MTHVSIVNKSTLFADADLPALANALQIQVTRDFLPAWGVDAKVFYTPSGSNPHPDHWVLALLDDADQSGALGYHDTSPTGLPIGKVFVRTTQSDGSSVSVTASHELLEMLGDPSINLTAEVDDGSGRPSKFYAYEVGDAVEADNLGYEIEIPAGWAGAGTKVLVSDFVLPSWFESFRTSGPFAFKTPLAAPLQLAPGGYISVLDLGNLSQGWQQIQDRTDAKSEAKSRPHQGSRRERRKLPRSQWLRSTYVSGPGAVPADSGPIPPFPQIAAKESRMKNVDQVTLITTDTATAADYDQAEANVANLANRNFRTEHLIVQMHIGGAGTPAQLKALDDATSRLAKSNDELAASLEAQKPQQ